jgi:CRP-like cAMP-binding protein
MDADDVAGMQRFKVGELIVDSGTPILLEGSNSPQLFTVLHGMGLRYRHLENGERQVINFIFPGDFLGLQAGLMGEMGHSVEATTKLTLCVFDRKELWSFIKADPERGFELAWLAAVEEHFMGETLTTVGQRTAIQAVAWAFVRVYLRAKASGNGGDGQMRFPFKQRDLADALGLSLVHTNKTISILKSRQLIGWSDDSIQINDLAALAEIGLTTLDDPKIRPIM